MPDAPMPGDVAAQSILDHASILITGATGSFGQAFTRHLLTHYRPRRICVYSRDEKKHADMAETFNHDPRLRFWVGDVRDERRLRDVLPGIDVVIHAAALKRVDTIAYNPSEALATNAHGTENVLRAARDAGIRHTLFISSDKAVRATTHYGASKAMGEYLTIGANVAGVPRGCLSACVRYGNVLGSRGSVVHIFRDAVAAGQPIPITDPLMTRFWLTLEAACELVTYAIGHMEGGEIYVPKLRASTIPDIAEAIAPGHPTTTVGLRAGGEKRHEEMMTEEESRRTIDPGPAYVILPSPHHWRLTARSGPVATVPQPYTSDTVPRIPPDELAALVAGIP